MGLAQMNIVPLRAARRDIMEVINFSWDVINNDPVFRNLLKSNIQLVINIKRGFDFPNPNIGISDYGRRIRNPAL